MVMLVVSLVSPGRSPSVSSAIPAPVHVGSSVFGSLTGGVS